jgi:ABC-type multidrug transport system ATPase subunit
MEEAEKLCDRIVIIDNGLILREGSLGELLGAENQDQSENGQHIKVNNLDDLFTVLTGRHLHE